MASAKLAHLANISRSKGLNVLQSNAYGQLGQRLFSLFWAQVLAVSVQQASFRTLLRRQCVTSALQIHPPARTAQRAFAMLDTRGKMVVRALRVSLGSISP